jgi:hypothetical protein
MSAEILHGAGHHHEDHPRDAEAKNEPTDPAGAWTRIS